MKNRTSHFFFTQWFCPCPRLMTHTANPGSGNVEAL